MKIFFILIACIAFQPSCKAQVSKPFLTDNKLKSHLDSVVNNAALFYMKDSLANGMSIGIYINSEKHTYNYGEVKQYSGKLPTADNFYNLGSVAKLFVTTMLAEAVTENKVKLTDDIRNYLPGEYPNLVYQGHAIELVNLANHSSALPGTFRSFPPATIDSVKKLSLLQQIHFYSLYTADSMLADLHKVWPDTIPGTAFRYNSTAMTLLVLLLERIYHTSYEQLLTRYLQSHLEMYDTKPSLTGEEMKQAVQGYNSKNQPQPYADLQGYYMGPGINSTINDMLKFIEANLLEKDKAIKLTHQLSWGKQNGFAVGLGWMMDNEKGEKYYYHDGNTKLGFNTLCTIYPSENTGIIIIVNDNISQKRVGALENMIMKQLAH